MKTCTNHKTKFITCLLVFTALIVLPFTTVCASESVAGREYLTRIQLQMDDNLKMMLFGTDDTGEVSDAVSEILNALEIQTFYVDGDKPEAGISLVLQDSVLLSAVVMPLTDGLIVETNLLPGRSFLIPTEYVDTLLQNAMPAENQADMEAFAEALLKYYDVISVWSSGLGGSVGAPGSVGEPVSATDKRNAAAYSAVIRIPAEEIKTLLISLAEIFASDNDLHELLALSTGSTAADFADTAVSVLAVAEALEPSGEALEFTLLYDGDDVMVGLDAVLPDLFGSELPSGSYSYGLLTKIEGVAVASHIGSMRWGESGEIKFNVTEGTDERNDPIYSLMARGKVQMPEADTFTDVMAIIEAKSSYEGTREILDGSVNIDLTEMEVPDEAQDGSESISFPAAPMRFGITYHSENKNELSDTSVGIELLGIKLGTVRIISSSSEHTADVERAQVTDITIYSDEDWEALWQELNGGVMSVSNQILEILPEEFVTPLLEGMSSEY